MIDTNPTQQPFTFVLFGATGDLSGRKIFPALYGLYKEQRLPKDIIIIGNSRTPRSDESFRELIFAQLTKYFGKVDMPTWHHLEKRIFFVPGNSSDLQTIEAIHNKMYSLELQGMPTQNCMYYVATIPELYSPILKHIGMITEQKPFSGWLRLLVEKPFGTDLTSAQNLNKIVKKYFNEDTVLRMDHFLAKETVQNILAFRFANGIFEPIWNKDFIDNIQITAFETNGVEGREIFYDNTGTLRDVVQNHVLELLSVCLMEMPKSLEPQSIRTSRFEVLKNLKIGKNTDKNPAVVYGQYGIGEIDGKEKRAYIQEENIPENSPTETFVALKTEVDLPRWQGVPIYIRAGKRMAQTLTEVSIQFKDPEKTLPQFKNKMSANILTIRIQPNEGILLSFDAKKPGFGYELQPVNMQFCYQNNFSQAPLIEAYQRLIYDAIAGDHTLFPTAIGVELAWEFITPLLQDRNEPKPLQNYPSGSWGPECSQKLLEKDGKVWIDPILSSCKI